MPDPDPLAALLAAVLDPAAARPSAGCVRGWWGGPIRCDGYPGAAGLAW